MNLENTIKKASLILKRNNIPSYELDAQIILSNIIGVNREFLITNNKTNISSPNKDKYEAAIKRRTNGEPIAYITGQKEFWSLDFLVNNSTLVPRPETEIMLYKLINFYKNKNISILDVGTGSGCIMLSLLKELKGSKGVGIDISSKAIQIAKLNAKKLNLNLRSKFMVSNISKFNASKFDLIVSNPPYIPRKDIKNLSRDIINFEPKSALDGGVDGLDLIKKVIYKSNYLLKRKGLLSLEIGYHQYHRVSGILKTQGYREMHKEYDYNRNIRCIISTKL